MEKVRKIRKVYCNYLEMVRYTLKGTITYEVKHPCSCCPTHTITREVNEVGTCAKSSDRAKNFIKNFKDHYGKYFNEYTNIQWVGTPVVTKEPFYED